MSRKVLVTPTSKPEDVPHLMTVRQAAAFTQQSEWAIRKGVDEGRYPGTTRFGKKNIRIPREHFLTTAADQRVLTIARDLLAEAKKQAADEKEEEMAVQS